MTFPDPPVGGLYWWWWRNSGAVSRARVFAAATSYIPNRDTFFWGDTASEWRLRVDSAVPDQPPTPPPVGDATWLAYNGFIQLERWRLDTNTWVSYSGTSGGSYLWQSASALGTTGGFRWRTLKDATFTVGVVPPATSNWDATAWTYVWPQDVEEIPLEVGGIRLTARPSVGVSASILEGIDGGSP